MIGLGFQDSGAVPTTSLPAGSAPEKCRSARLAIVFYRAKTWAWQDLREGRRADRTPLAKSCHWSRYAAREWHARARSARRSFIRWHRYHYDWPSWLPSVWQRIGACETGYGRRPGRWNWNSGRYQGAFGFFYGTWDSYRHRADPKAGPYPDDAYEATPRQQYEVALAVYRAVGIHAWGCA